MIDISKSNCTSKSLTWKDSNADNVADYKSEALSFFICADLAEGAQKTVSDVFGEVEILSRAGQPEGEIAFVTPAMSEYELEEKLGVLSNLMKVKSMIRVLDY